MMLPTTKGQAPTSPAAATGERRASLSESFTGFGTKLSKILSNTSSTYTAVTQEGLKTNAEDRSRSRGREGFKSSGRGGAGNIRPASKSRDARPDTAGPDDFSDTRGREMGVTSKVTHSGRGGAGNIRSPSRELGAPPLQSTATELEALARAAEHNAELPHSSGRGGLGNIARSRSRSRTAGDSPRGRSVGAGAGAVHSSGRGGAGNIVHGVAAQEGIEEQERRQHHVQEGIHSTGRGGAANITSEHAPGIDAPAPAHEAHEVHSSGRGGAGNIRGTSMPREGDGEGRGRSKDRSGLGGMWDRVMSKERKE